MQLSGYRTIQTLYNGRNSQVFRAIREVDGVPVILKILNEAFPSHERVARFQYEFDLTQKLNIHGLIKAYGLEKHQSYWVIVFEDFGGESLENLSAKKPLFVGREQLPSFLHIAITITQILGQLHQQQVIHKDINPANIVYHPGTGQIKLIDLGLATVLSREATTFTNPNTLEGTLAYISPEQTGRMNRPVDYRTDLYSLGVTFYEMLTGQRPFTAEDPLALVHAHIARQPAPLFTHQADIPQPLNEIVLKLLAKNAEDRYQSAYGLQADLEKCLEQFKRTGQIELFAIGQKDRSAQFHIPQKLYGRETELQILLNAFERVHKGASEIMLVAGHSGIGKSALIQEIYKPVTEQRGYFIAGKFDQFNRVQPYHSLIQAFRTLMQHLLGESEAQVQQWRKKILRAVGNNGQVIVAVIPEVELIIGEQPALLPLPPAEAQNRFRLTFQNFIKCFAQPEHPLVLFVDDLQWADYPSLQMLHLLMAGNDCPHLLVIGAYRDNEIHSAHILNSLLDALQKERIVLNNIFLTPLKNSHVQQLVADTLHLPAGEVSSLAELVQAKTGGSPFFINEFLQTLYAEQLVTFDPQNGRWVWDEGQIQAQNFTPNVVELLAEKVQKLDKDTQHVLSLASFLGNQFDLQTLALVAETSPQDTAQKLWPALQDGIIVPLDDHYHLATIYVEGTQEALNIRYRFAHDHLQQAVYDLTPESERPQLRLWLGQLLWRLWSEERRERRLFDLVNHLNTGSALVRDPQEKLWLLELNLKAGRRAKASSAYEPAYSYLTQARQFAPADLWQTKPDLALALYTEAAEAAALVAKFDEMEKLGQEVITHARSPIESAKIYQIRIHARSAQTDPTGAVYSALEGLCLLGIHLPQKATQRHILMGLAKTKWLLWGKSVEQLADLPPMSDPYKLAAMEIMMEVGAAAYISMPQMFALMAFKLIELSLKYGNAPGTAQGYATYAIILCGNLGDIEGGYQFSQLALQLLNKNTARHLRPKVLLSCYGFVRHWKDNYKSTLAPLMEGYQVGLETGDINFAAYSITTYTLNALLTGMPLRQIEDTVHGVINTLQQFGHNASINYNRIRLQMVANYRGESETPWVLVGEYGNEPELVAKVTEAKDRLGKASIYSVKISVLYGFGKFEEAGMIAEELLSYRDTGRGSAQFLNIVFYTALTFLALYPSAAPAKKKLYLKEIHKIQKFFTKWVKFAPANFLGKQKVIEAEYARVHGRLGEARELYDQAIAGAQMEQMLPDEALFNEITGRFYAQQNLLPQAELYLRQAHYLYQQWGALAKTRYLDATYPFLAQSNLAIPLNKATLTTTFASTASSSTRLFDLASLAKASQVISEEILLDKLLVKLMQTVLESAGAERGCLLLPHENGFVIEAEGWVTPAGAIEQNVLNALPVIDRIPAAVVNYVNRTQSHVVLNNALEHGQFSQDNYIRVNRPQSVLCLPLLNRGELSGILYLENSVIAGAFTADRLELLNLLSSQAAISIDNARLYARLTEAKEQLEESNRTLEQRVAERTKELNAEVVEREKLIEELNAFSHTVAHDLKSPLTSMVGYGEILLEDVGQREMDADEVTVMLENMVRGARRMQRIIEGLLTLALTRQGDVKLQQVEMNRVLDEVLDRLWLFIDQAQAEIHRPDSWPAVVGHAPWIEEIWANYVSNALKYGGTPPRLEFGYNLLDNGQVRFWLKDNGQGLTAEQQATVFTPFTRLNQVKTDGHGLGLSIVQRIVERLGGRVGLESTVGQGSTFYFTLPKA